MQSETSRGEWRARYLLPMVCLTALALVGEAAAQGHCPAFRAAASFAAGDFPRHVAVSDLDGDRAPDIVTAGGGVTILLNQCDPPSLPVDLDIKPGSDLNAVNPSLGGVLPVAILGSEQFDVTDVDVTTLAFGPGGASFAHPRGPHFEDVNGDGRTDLLAHYRVENTGTALGDTDACLSGKTLDGTPFGGCDAVRTVPAMNGDVLSSMQRRWRSEPTPSSELPTRSVSTPAKQCS